MNRPTTRLNTICEQSPYELRWYVRDIGSGNDAHRNGDDVIPSASTRKVAIMMALLRGVSNGRWELDETIPTTAEYQQGNFIGAILDALEPGLELSLRDHIVMMITLSDNVSTGILTDRIGLDEVNQFCRDIGMGGTTHRVEVPSNEPGVTRTPESGNTTTANDQGLLLTEILEGSQSGETARELGCTREHCRLALDILGRQKYRRRLPGLLPPHANVAHKTGTVVGGWTETGIPICEGYHDIGIVSDGSEPAYVITVFTNDVPETLNGSWPTRAHASHTIALINRICWDHFVDDGSDSIDLDESPYNT